MERLKITTKLREIFHGDQDRLFIAPICSACHRRFAELNQTVFESANDFDML
jgi:hypothetical protein